MSDIAATLEVAGVASGAREVHSAVRSGRLPPGVLAMVPAGGKKLTPGAQAQLDLLWKIYDALARRLGCGARGGAA